MKDDETQKTSVVAMSIQRFNALACEYINWPRDLGRCRHLLAQPKRHHKQLSDHKLLSHPLQTPLLF